MTNYNEMAKPDRDRTEAKAAEEEFQTFLAKYPKDPLVPKAEQHLREVQEVLAEGRFPHWLLLLRERRPARGGGPAAVGHQALSAIQQIGRCVVDAGRYFRKE